MRLRAPACGNSLTGRTELSLIVCEECAGKRANRVELRDVSPNSRGLPEDYIRNHPADAQGVITITTDYPDMQPVMTFATSSEELRLRMFRAYNTRAYPANRQRCCWDLLAVRHAGCDSILGFRLMGGPGDRQPDDGFGGET